MKAARYGMVALVALFQTVAVAAEMGRQEVSGANLPTIQQAGPVRVVKNYSGMAEGGGLEVGVDWVALNWDVGSDSYSDNGWAPSLAVFYGIGNHVDLKADVRYLELDADADEGKTDPTLSVMRLAFGGRGWLELAGDFYGYAGVALAYYSFDGDAVESAKGTIGGAIEGGVAYLINERAYVRMGLQFEQTLSDAEGTTDSDEELDVSMRSVGFGLGVGVRF